MTNYKRLTRRNEDGTTWVKCVSCDKVATCDYTKESCCQVLQNRLAELEDKIEQGTLVPLPLPLGADCWCVVNAVSQKDAFVRKQKFTLWLYDDGRWGRIVFATKAEAEAKLAELKRSEK